MKSEVEIKEKLAYWYQLAEELRIRMPKVPHLEWRGEDKDIITFVFYADEFSKFLRVVNCQSKALMLNWVLGENKTKTGLKWLDKGTDDLGGLDVVSEEG